MAMQKSRDVHRGSIRINASHGPQTMSDTIGK